MTLTNGYRFKEKVVQHPLGTMNRVYKEEYSILFERCVILGKVDNNLQSCLKRLRYNSYIVSYDDFEGDKIVLENIYPLKAIMNSSDIKKLIIDILSAIEVLQCHHLSINLLNLSNIYRSSHHYKLDCFDIATRDYELLVQDLCLLFLNIIDSQEKELLNVLTMYSNLKFQKSIKKMIKRVSLIKTNNTNYEVKNTDFSTRKNTYFSSSLIFLIIDQYIIYILVFLVIILIFLL